MDKKRLEQQKTRRAVRVNAPVCEDVLAKAYTSNGGRWPESAGSVYLFSVDFEAAARKPHGKTALINYYE